MTHATLLRRIADFRRDDRGATAIEYGLILALMFVAIVGALSALSGSNGGSYQTMMGKVQTSMDDASS